MTDATTPFPTQIGSRLNDVAQANQLGEFRRIIPVNEAQTAGNSFLWAGISAACGLVPLAILWWAYATPGTHRIPVILWALPLCLLAVPFFIIQGLGRARAGKQWVGVWDHGLLSTTEKLPGVTLVRFDRGTATVRVTQPGDKGKRADQVTLTATQDGKKIEIEAKTDKAWIEINDVLARFGQAPLVRAKEPGYKGE